MSRRNYRNIGIIAFLLAVIIAFQMLLSRNKSFLHFYEDDIFIPLQRLRSKMLNIFGFSIGDYIYLILLLALLYFFIKLIAQLIAFKKNKKRILPSAFQLSITALLIYLGFVLLWGGNYARPNITAGWDKNKPWDKTSLVALNEFLINKLNEEAPLAKYQNDAFINRTANGIYKEILGGHYDYLNVKPSSLGNGLNYFGIQGYYNPLSGEGQFNRHLPVFMHPFVITHEMAHQTGIAAEDNANLMAYIVCTRSQDAMFRYSAYINIFLYAYSELKGVNKSLAEDLFANLNDISKNNIVELKELRKHYKTIFRGFSMGMYNQYLVWQGQERGVESYDDVTKWVYMWEQGQKQKADNKICLH